MAVDLIRQKELDVDQNAIKQIEFTGFGCNKIQTMKLLLMNPCFS